MQCLCLSPRLSGIGAAAIGAGVVLGAAGCASVGSQRPAITGEHSARYTNVATPEAFAETPNSYVSVEHTFTIHNDGDEPATIVSHTTTRNTVWHFVDTRDGGLPRTLAPDETVGIWMRGRLYEPESRRFYSELMLNTGEAVRLELHVDD